jgi:Sulfotransferase family
MCEGASMPPLIDVVYIAGAGRSGSTVIENRLAAALGAPAVGESVYLWHHGVLDDQLCGCGEPFSHCPFWTEVMRQGIPPQHVDALQQFWAARLHGLRAIPRILFLGRRDKTLDRAARAYGALFSAVATVSGSTTLVESSKEPGFWLFLRLVPGIRVRTLHVVRDSRAVAFSWRRLVVKPELASQRLEHMGRNPYWSTALKWDIVNIVFSAGRGHLHGSTFATLHYEEFAAAPDQFVAHALERLELEAPATAEPGAVDDRSVQHSVAGNPVRFQPERLSSIAVDDEWTRSMPRLMRALVTALTFPLLAAYGYVGPRAGR